MRKLTLLILCTLISLTSMAEIEQDAIAVTLGFTQSIVRVNSPDPSLDAQQLYPNITNGIKLGFMYDATIIRGFGFAVGLNYAYTGKNSDWENYDKELGVETKERVEKHQIEIPLDIQYKFEIAMDTWLMLYTGPTFQWIVKYSDNEYYRYKLNPDEPYIWKYKYSDADLEQYFHKVSVAWGVGAGFQYKRLFLRGGYDFGLMNPYKETNFNRMEIPGWSWPSGYSRATRGRWDQWQLKVGFYIWQRD